MAEHPWSCGVHDAPLAGDGKCSCGLSQRREIANRLRSQPWVNALPIADAIEEDEWDV